MKRTLAPLLVAAGLLVLGSCDQVMDDLEPKSFQDFQVYSDDVYLYNGSTGNTLVRMDPLINDSIKTDVTVTYSQPRHGQLSVEPDGATYYAPEPGYYGTDSVTYTACSDQICKSARINLILERPVDPTNCTITLGADSLVIDQNTSGSLRIFLNDVICSPQTTGISIYSPQKGTYKSMQYSGSLKNTIYIYTPPKNFVGEDSFKYRVHPDPQNFDKVYLEMVVRIKVK